MTPRSITGGHESALNDLSPRILRISSEDNGTTTGTIRPGRVLSLEPERFRRTLASPVPGARRHNQGEIDKIVGISVQPDREFGQTVGVFRRRSSRVDVRRPESAADAEQLIGISLRAVLHFWPGTPLVEQETAIEEAVMAVEDEIIRTEVDRTFRANDLWLVLRCNVRAVIADVGYPNRPFDEILLWREGESGPLVNNLNLKPGERLIVEPSVAVPIDFRPAGF